jgi:hypothetical protein
MVQQIMLRGPLNTHVSALRGGENETKRSYRVL